MINYLKRLWDALWAKTDLDEKAAAALEEAKSRLAAVRKELEDVKNAATGNRNKKRKGKKPYYKNKKRNQTNNNKPKK